MSHKISSNQYINRMLENDAFSEWMDISVRDTGKGYAEISMKVRSEMLNGFGILHGGIFFALADSAFAFAANTYGNLSVALDADIRFLSQAREGDLLIAQAIEIKNGNKTGVYEVRIENSEGKQLAHFTGTVFRTGKEIK